MRHKSSKLDTQCNHLQSQASSPWDPPTLQTAGDLWLCSQMTVLRPCSNNLCAVQHMQILSLHSFITGVGHLSRTCLFYPLHNVKGRKHLTYSWRAAIFKLPSERNPEPLETRRVSWAKAQLTKFSIPDLENSLIISFNQASNIFHLLLYNISSLNKTLRAQIPIMSYTSVYSSINYILANALDALWRHVW